MAEVVRVQDISSAPVEKGLRKGGHGTAFERRHCGLVNGARLFKDRDESPSLASSPIPQPAIDPRLDRRLESAAAGSSPR